jgi:hypothetical protein
MRTSASSESAEHSLRKLVPALARLRAGDLLKVLGGVAAIFLFLELAYLAAANLVLRSQLIQGAVSSSEGFGLEFSHAHSLWPGHVHVRDLSLRISDYNVQFEVALDSADVDIALTELPFKKFHVTKLRAEGTRFRFRHKLVAVGEDGERVDAFPPIKGFPDPPYFVGVPAPATPPEDYDLWEVRMQDVLARVRELWVMEYRFQGQGVAAGAFVVQPERWVQVQPGSLDLEHGTLRLGAHQVATNVRGRITCDIPDMRVPETEGRQVLRDILAAIRLELSGGDLSFLGAYLTRFGGAQYDGPSDIRVDLAVSRGVLTPASRVQLTAKPLVVRHPLAQVSGDVMLGFSRESADEQLSMAVSAPRLTAERAGQTAPSPQLQGVRGSAVLRGADFKKDFTLGEVSVAVERAVVPALAWFAQPGRELSGSGEASFRGARRGDGSVSGQASARLRAASFASDDLAASGDVDAELELERGATERELRLEKATLALSTALFRSGDKRSKPFAARLDGSGLLVEPDAPASASGELRLHVSSAAALLPLVMVAPLRGVASTALDLESLEARATLRVSGQALELRRIDARSGNLHVKGYLTRRGAPPRGAFLLSSGPFNVGVALEGGETAVSPFVADSWLASASSEVR